VLRPALDATPWLLPALVVTALIAAATYRAVARRLGVSRWHAVALLLTLGAIVAVTLTPSLDAGWWQRSRIITFELPASMAADLMRVSETSLNVALFVPLAALVQLVERPWRGRLLVAVIALPLAVELMQYALPVLGRSGFQLADVAANLLGVLLGTTLGWSGARLARTQGRTATRSRPKPPLADVL